MFGKKIKETNTHSRIAAAATNCEKKKELKRRSHRDEEKANGVCQRENCIRVARKLPPSYILLAIVIAAIIVIVVSPLLYYVILVLIKIKKFKKIKSFVELHVSIS